MQNITITTSPAPAWDTTLASIENGDALNTANHELQTQDIADRLGHLKATKADSASPTFTGTVTVAAITASGAATFNGSADFNGATTLDGATTINGATTIAGATTVTGAIEIQDLTVDPTQVALSPAISAARRSCKSPMVIENGTAGRNVSGVTSLTVETGESAFQFIDAPNGSELTSVRVYVDPQAGSPLPGTRVSARVRRRDKSTGTPSSLSSLTVDPNATIGVYQPYHSFDVTLTSPETIDHQSYFYWIELVGELPTNEGDVIWHGSDYIINNDVGDFT